jgi:hypothetical protein
MAAYNQTLERRQALSKDLPTDLDSSGASSLALDIVNRTATEPVIAGVRNYLALWEQYATAVNCEVLDFVMMERLAGTKIISIARNYRPYIDFMREERQNDRLYSELLTLAREIGEARGELPEPQG